MLLSVPWCCGQPSLAEQWVHTSPQACTALGIPSVEQPGWDPACASPRQDLCEASCDGAAACLFP